MSKPKKRRMPHIVSGRTKGSACPNCLNRLDGVTGVLLDGFFESPPKLKGHATMCCYCGALLTFADDAGTLRMMTEAERNSFKPESIISELLAKVKAGARQPDFTKRNPN